MRRLPIEKYLVRRRGQDIQRLDAGSVVQERGSWEASHDRVVGSDCHGDVAAVSCRKEKRWVSRKFFVRDDLGWSVFLDIVIES